MWWGEAVESRSFPTRAPRSTSQSRTPRNPTRVPNQRFCLLRRLDLGERRAIRARSPSGGVRDSAASTPCGTACGQLATWFPKPNRALVRLLRLPDRGWRDGPHPRRYRIAPPWPDESSDPESGLADPGAGDGPRCPICRAAVLDLHLTWLPVSRRCRGARARRFVAGIEPRLQERARRDGSLGAPRRAFGQPCTRPVLLAHPW